MSKTSTRRFDLNRRKVVFTESQIIPNVDAGLFLPFKQEYHAGRVLIGGFARLGGSGYLTWDPEAAGDFAPLTP